MKILNIYFCLKKYYILYCRMSNLKRNCKFNKKQQSKINYGSELDIDKIF